ncbi:helix-turn-helix domain-containing protein [Leifsonia sp. P73]|uniref:helix-turn-helix domain-containing protein n=1 Tax=Leifsonia sp. P73 TaxID=3423959 RepID=UPI003DA5AD4C
MTTQSSGAARIVGARLRERRTALGLSQHTVALDSGVDVANYGNLERGTGNPTLLTLLRLAVRLDVDPAELLDGLTDRGLLPPEARPYTATEFRREAQRHAGHEQRNPPGSERPGSA